MPTFYKKVIFINIISTINNYGTCHFLCYHENITYQLFIDFMKRLITNTDRKVLFIVDNFKVHHGKIVVEWSSEYKGEIKLFFTSP